MSVSLARDLAQNRFARFLAVGVVNTIFGYSLFLVLVHMPIPLFVAMTLGQIGGVLFNFQTTGALVFSNRDPRLLWRFALVNVFMLGLNYVALRGLLALGFALIPASAGLVLPMAIVSYVVSRTFVFREPRPESDR